MTVQNYVLAKVNDLTGCSTESGGPNLVYGNLTGPVPTCGNPSGTAGITFLRQGTQPAGGNFLFVQLITSDTSSDGVNSSGKTYKCTASGGIDGAYPYQGAINPASRNDAPTMPLPYSPSASRAFNATMYLMWQSSTANSIPVPLGYIPWTFNATATCNKAPCNVAADWTPNGNGGPTKQFTASLSTSPNLGYPTWSGPSKSACAFQ